MDIDKLINLTALKTEVQLRPNRWRGKESAWSKSFYFGNDDAETVANGLIGLFGISNLDKKLFNMAVNGDGQELRKICTLHSSSLLAFLFFSGVSEKNTLSIKGIEYDKCFFEIQNKVFPNSKSTDKPSNVDVVLYSTRSKQLLFIESKFTEYSSHGKAFAADKYHDVVVNIIEKFKLNLHIEEGIVKEGKTGIRTGFNICLNEGKNDQYIEGFKQAISHIIGIVTGEPTEHNPKEYFEILDERQSLAFASIIFDIKNINSGECKKYSDFYKSTIGKLSELNTFKSIFSIREFKHNEVNVFDSVLTYQGLITDNPQYALPSAFKGYYRIKE